VRPCNALSGVFGLHAYGGDIHSFSVKGTESSALEIGAALALLHPPRPRLVFRVGVVGHRPNRLQNADFGQLAGVIRSVFSGIQAGLEDARKTGEWFYGEGNPLLRAISPLAEGVDRIFAKEALDFGAELCCVMPFPQAEFERDFAHGKALEPDSLDHFRALVDRSATKFELDGCRSDEAAAYGVAGAVVLNQADVLVVVWDGEHQGRRGGTEQTFKNARVRGVPVVWIDAHAPHRWQIIDAAIPLHRQAAGRHLEPDDSNPVAILRKFVRDGLDLPKSSEYPGSGGAGDEMRGISDQKCAVRRFYGESQPHWKWAVAGEAFRDIVGDARFPKLSFSVIPFEDAVKREWPEDRSTPTGRVVDFLRPFYAWTDKLSVGYGDKYRSAFILAFLLASGAVGMALLPVGAGLTPDHPARTAFVGLELAMILAILGLVYQGRRCKWHERWIDYRIAAELVRHLRLVAPLGGGARSFPQVPAHRATYGQPGTSWMAWYVRAIERALGLPTAEVDREHLLNSVSRMEFLINGQVEYHKTNTERCQRIEKRLHYWGFLLLLFTLVCCVLHFLPTFWPGHHENFSCGLDAWLTFFCGFLPALGAALAGIFNQGEFRRIAKRSEAMAQQLGRVLDKVTELHEEIDASPMPPDRQFSPRVGALASDTARLLVSEILDWRVVFLDQPLNPPA